MVDTTDIQQGDVFLCQTLNNGDISVQGGITVMVAGLEVAVYLALFGGNEDDDGSDANPLNWWGNVDEPAQSRQYRSRTQFLLQALPATARNLKRLEDAIRSDTKFLLTDNIASSVGVELRIPAINRIDIGILIEANGEEFRFNFTENWKASVS